MTKNMKNALQNKTYSVCFAVCFLLATPVFIKGMHNMYIEDTINMWSVVANMSLYLCCIINMPRYLAEKIAT